MSARNVDYMTLNDVWRNADMKFENREPSAEESAGLLHIAAPVPVMVLALVCAFVGACWFVAWGIQLVGAIIRLVLG